MTCCNMFRLSINGFAPFNVQAASLNVNRHFSRKLDLKILGLPEKPKRPKSSFLFYLDGVRDELRSAGHKEGEVTKIAGQNWKALSAKEKEKYVAKYEKAVAVYKQNLEKYESLLSEEQKQDIIDAKFDLKQMKEQQLKKSVLQQKIVDLNKPKKPCTAFALFVQKQDRVPDESPQDFIKRCSKLWNQLPAAKKQEYKDNYIEDTKMFHKKLEMWEEEMINQGHIDLVRSKTLKEKVKST